MSKPINTTFFANLQRTSQLEVSGTVAGKVCWSVAGPEMQPGVCALYDSMLCIWYGTGVAAYSCANGSLLWNRSMAATTDPLFTSDGIRYSDDNGYIHLIAPDGTVSREYNVGFFTEFFHLFYILHTGSDIRYLFNLSHSPQGPLDQNGLAAATIDATTNLPAWLYRQFADATFFAMPADMSLWFVVIPDTILVIPPGSKNDGAVQSFPAPGVQALSILPSGELLVSITNDSKMHVIKKIKQDGTVLWESSPLAESATPFAPSQAPNEIVYYPGGNQLVALRDGAVEWSEEITPVPAKTHLRVLSDNSVLVAVNNVLFHFSPSGKCLLRHPLPFVITAAPVMDTDGKVYCAGTKRVICLQ